MPRAVVLVVALALACGVQRHAARSGRGPIRRRSHPQPRRLGDAGRQRVGAGADRAAGTVAQPRPSPRGRRVARRGARALLIAVLAGRPHQYLDAARPPLRWHPHHRARHPIAVEGGAVRRQPLRAHASKAIRSRSARTLAKPPAPGHALPAWRGDELVAFRLHLPARIRFQNSRYLDCRRVAPRVARQHPHLGAAPAAAPRRAGRSPTPKTARRT